MCNDFETPAYPIIISSTIAKEERRRKKSCFNITKLKLPTQVKISVTNPRLVYRAAVVGRLKELKVSSNRMFFPEQASKCSPPVDVQSSQLGNYTPKKKTIT
jgi:hypothetical protein